MRVIGRMPQSAGLLSSMDTALIEVCISASQEEKHLGAVPDAASAQRVLLRPAERENTISRET